MGELFGAGQWQRSLLGASCIAEKQRLQRSKVTPFAQIAKRTLARACQVFAIELWSFAGAG
jgi:hypothetical protein